VWTAVWTGAVQGQQRHRRIGVPERRAQHLLQVMREVLAWGVNGEGVGCGQQCGLGSAGQRHRKRWEESHEHRARRSLQ
jgi:hypothetical protein